MIDVFPPNLALFSGRLHLIEGSVPASGTGRVSFALRERSGRREVLLRLGPHALVADLGADLAAWRSLTALARDRAPWYARVDADGDDVALTLFGLRDAVPVRGATVGVAEELGNDLDLVRPLLHLDAWSHETYGVVRADIATGRSHLVGSEAEAEMTIVDRALIHAPLRHRDQFAPSRWLVIAGTELGGESEYPWDPDVLGRLEQSSGGLGQFLEAWSTYASREEELLNQLRDSVDRVRYGRVREAEDNGMIDSDRLVTIGLDPAQPGAATFLRALDQRAAAGVQLAVEVTEEDPWIVERQQAVVGHVRMVDPASGDLQIAVRASDLVGRDGWCAVSVRGDLAQISRRQHALRQLVEDRAGIPALRSLLAGDQGLPPRPPSLRGASRGSLGDDLTARQRRAVEIALSSPDIAMIQGPPGTGKTKVIAAIENALGEMDGPNRTNRLILLTSTQNDAVDQVAARTRVFGLPPNRVGAGATIDPVADWRRERLAASLEVLDASTEYRRNRLLADRYAHLSGSAVNLDQLVIALDELAAMEIDEEIGRRARSSAADLRHRRMKRSRRDRLEARIRSLRTSAAAWADDGAERADELARDIDGPDLTTTWGESFRAPLARLAGASDPWAGARELKNEMLDRLADEVDDRPRAVPKEVLDLFADAIGVAQRQLSTRGGHPLTVEQALEAYVEDIEQHPDEADAAIREYTVVHAATCQGASAFTRLDNEIRSAATFENAIVDEAARVSPLDLLIPLVQARRRVILVGDHRQLPAIYDDRIAQGLPQGDLLAECLFERLYTHLKAQDVVTGIQRTITLDRQFRMHPRLGSFVSRIFYEPHGERIENGATEDDLRHEVQAFRDRTSVWVDVPASEGPAVRSPRRSWSRSAEADTVAALVSEIVHQHPGMSVGVITFYSEQRDLILERLADDLTERTPGGATTVRPEYATLMRDGLHPEERLRIGTVDAFQGKEFDIVVLSMVRSDAIRSDRSPRSVFGFLTVENRFCVALSRQKRLLIVVGDRAMIDHPQASAIVGLRELRDLCDQEAAGDAA